MRPVLAICTWLAGGGLACGLAAADSPAPPFTPVAHSALLTLDAAGTPAELTLRVRRTQGDAPLAVTALAVSIDGRSVPATVHADGTWSVPWPPGPQHAGTIEAVVTHDNLREVLSGTLPAAVTGGSAGGSGLLRSHKQMAWWILNIAIVLIAAIAISRRLS